MGKLSGFGSVGACRKEAKFGLCLGLGMIVVPTTSALPRPRAVLDMLKVTTDSEWGWL